MHTLPSLPRVRIDLNVRIGTGQTYSGFADISGAEPQDMPRGTEVEVYEEESGLHGHAVVAGRDFDRDLIYLAVDWAGLREKEPEPWPWLLALLAWLAENRRAFHRARCRRLGHKAHGGRLRWPPEPGRFAAQAVCRRCGEGFTVDVPLRSAMAQRKGV